MEKPIAKVHVKRNGEKGLSYTAAWGRIKASQVCGFYLEAITLEESIISDRLISHLTGVGEKSIQCESDMRESLSSLIIRLERSLNHGKSEVNDKNLVNRLNSWREKRNCAVHGMVKSIPGTKTEKVDDFLEKAKECAKEGEKIARDVCNWQRKEFRKSKCNSIERKK